MQCFCEFVEENFETEEFSSRDLVFQVPDPQDPTNKSKYEDKLICDIYVRDKIYFKVLGQSISFIIIAVNQILKTLIISLTTWIGDDTVSK